MIIKASGCSALILAAGFFVLLATPAKAATEQDSATDAKSDNSTAAPVTHRHASHHRRHYAHHKLHAVATADADNDNKTAVVTDAVIDNSQALPTVSPSIANANAQMLLAGVHLDAAAAIPAGTGATAAASDNADADNRTVVVAADQLNDVDRTLQESSPTPAATAGSPPAPATTTTMTGESTVWNQTSLIGKIFIGFGALLTMASAARMFIT